MKKLCSVLCAIFTLAFAVGWGVQAKADPATDLFLADLIRTLEVLDVRTPLVDTSEVQSRNAVVTAAVPIDPNEAFAPAEEWVTLELKDALAQEAANMVAEMIGVVAPKVRGRIWMSVTNAPASKILEALANVGRIAWDFQGLDYVIWYDLDPRENAIEMTNFDSDDFHNMEVVDLRRQKSGHGLRSGLAFAVDRQRPTFHLEPAFVHA